jgi:hypothetical protein
MQLERQRYAASAATPCAPPQSQLRQLGHLQQQWSRIRWPA